MSKLVHNMFYYIEIKSRSPAVPDEVKFKTIEQIGG